MPYIYSHPCLASSRACVTDSNILRVLLGMNLVQRRIEMKRKDREEENDFSTKWMTWKKTCRLKTELSPGELYRINNYVPIIDHLCTALRTRMEAYKSLSEKFGSLSTITKLTSEELREAERILYSIIQRTWRTNFSPKSFTLRHRLKGLYKLI